jgi:hypothetical protein
MDGTFIAPHTLAMDSHGDLYVGEVSYLAWPHVFPCVPKPTGIRRQQKLLKVSQSPGIGSRELTW